MLFVFAMKATKMMRPTTSGSVSTLMTYIMLVGVQPMPDHLFHQNVSRVGFLCPHHYYMIDLCIWYIVLL